MLPDAGTPPTLRLAALRAPGGPPISLDVLPGEAVSLLGGDAAGVVAMVAGLIRPQSGSVTMGGRVPKRAGLGTAGLGALIGPPALLPQCRRCWRGYAGRSPQYDWCR